MQYLLEVDALDTPPLGVQAVAFGEFGRVSDATSGEACRDGHVVVAAVGATAATIAAATAATAAACAAAPGHLARGDAQALRCRLRVAAAGSSCCGARRRGREWHRPQADVTVAFRF